MKWLNFFQKKKDSTEKAVEVKQPVEIVSFRVDTIHKDRLGTILPAIMSIERPVTYRSYSTLRELWKKSAMTGKWDQGWFGSISASGPKDLLLAKAKKIAKAGGTIVITSEHDLKIPPPNKWWLSRYVIWSTPKPPKDIKQMEVEIGVNFEVKTEDMKVKTEDTKVKTEDTKVKTEDTKVKTEDTKVKTEDTKVKTEDMKVKTEDTKVKTEDTKVKTEDTKVNSEVNSEVKNGDTEVK